MGVLRKIAKLVDNTNLYFEQKDHFKTLHFPNTPYIQEYFLGLSLANKAALSISIGGFFDKYYYMNYAMIMLISL